MPTIFTRRAHRALKGLAAVILAVGISPPGIAQPQETQESAVADCQFLGKIEGWSGYGKNFTGWQPLAKASALHKADSLGASHVVWQRMIPVGSFNGYAVARAYNCQR